MNTKIKKFFSYLKLIFQYLVKFNKCECKCEKETKKTKKDLQKNDKK